MNMEILNSTTADIETIFELYDAAIAHQKAVSHLHWLPFERSLVEAEIAEGRQWKIMVEGQIACIFVTAYSDPDIWGEKDGAPSVYLHRIVTHPKFRGQNFVAVIVQWAKTHGSILGKKFVRLDTWSENPRLKEHYLRCGFQFVGVITPTNFTTLPSHYAGISLGLFEISIEEKQEKSLSQQ